MSSKCQQIIAASYQRLRQYRRTCYLKTDNLNKPVQYLNNEHGITKAQESQMDVSCAVEDTTNYYFIDRNFSCVQGRRFFDHQNSMLFTWQTRPTLRSGGVIGVDPHILIGQIAAPGKTVAWSIPQLDPDLHRLATKHTARRLRIKGKRLPRLHQLMRTNPERNLLRIERNTGTPSGSDNPAPVGITAVNCCFHQR